LARILILDVSPVHNKIVVIAGPRRSGKTFLLFSKLKESATSCLYVDLEHSAFAHITHKDFFEIINFLGQKI
jgi:predicted AAA+ superfamily ATPase